MGRNKKPTMFQDIIYKLIAADCVAASKTKGEGLAKKLAKKVAIQMLSPQQRVIYKTMAKHMDKYPDGMPTIDVAYLTQLDPTSVASQLSLIYRTSHLVVNVSEGRHRYWKLV